MVSSNKDQVLAKLDFLMAGRAAESMIFGKDNVMKGLSCLRTSIFYVRVQAILKYMYLSCTWGFEFLWSWFKNQVFLCNNNMTFNNMIIVYLLKIYQYSKIRTPPPKKKKYRREKKDCYWLMTMSFYGETLEVLTSHRDCLWPVQRVCHELDPRSFGKVYGHWNEKN